jgi:hypothetical protein
LLDCVGRLLYCLLVLPFVDRFLATRRYAYNTMDHPKSKKQKVQDIDRSELEAEATRLQAEVARFQVEAARSQAEAALPEFVAEVARLQAEALATSLLSVLPKDGDDNKMPRLVLRGTKCSHLRPKNEDTEVIERKFIVPDVRAADDELDLGLKNKVSSLRAVITNSNGSLHYGNEFDVHDYIQLALRDATATR